MKYSNAYAIFIKEFKSYLYSLSSYIFIIVFLTVLIWLFFQDLFFIGQASMRQFFAFLPWFFLFLIPALSMKMWSEEKRQGTIENLLVLPLFEWQLVLAKFFSGFLFLGIALLFSFSVPITLEIIGDLDLGQTLGSYLAAWLFGGSILALGQFISSSTKNQLVAFLVSIALCAFFIFIGLPFLLARAGALGNILYVFSSITHYENMSAGVIDLRDVLYFLSFIGLFLYLNVYSLIQRHWK